MIADLPERARAPLEALLRGARESGSDELAIVWAGARRAWRFGAAQRGAQHDEEPIETMSVTKSVVGLAVGRLVALGRLASVDEPVCALFPEWRQGRKRRITVRMLLEHTSGLQNVPMTTEEIMGAPDLVQLALCAELDADPGARYAYNNKAVNLLAGVVARADGRDLAAFVRDELFAPLGIADASWQRDPAGNPHTMSGLALHAEDLVRIGELLLERGVWRGERLIDAAWFEAMERPGGVAEESALLWWRVRRTRIEVNETHLSALRAADADAGVVDLFEALQGEHRSAMAFFVRLRDALGFAWRERLPAGVQPFALATGELLGFRGEGDLGQHLWVLPEARLVVARLVRESTVANALPEAERGPPKDRDEHLRRLLPFAFADIETRVLELAEALAGAAPPGR